MAYSDFDKLKAFFFELKSTNFHPEKMRSGFPMNGVWVTVNKAECFDLLRQKIPDLKGKDDAYLIKYLSDPRNIKNRVLAEFVAGERIELEKTLAEAPVTAAEISGQPVGQETPTGQEIQPAGGVGAPTGGMPFGMPSAPYIPPISRTYKIPQAPPGSVPPQPKIVTATRSGAIVEKPQPSQLVTATSSGVIREAPPKQIFIANKSGVVTGVRNIKPPSWLKTFGSNAQIFVRKNLGRIAGGLTDIAKGVGRGITGAASTGLGAATPSLGRAFHGGLNGIERLSRPGGVGGGGGIGKLSKSSNKFALGFIGIMLFFVLIGGLLGSLAGPTPTGQAGPISGGAGCPDTSGNTTTCRYLNPSINLFDTNLSQSAIDSYVNNYSLIFINAGKGDLNEFKTRTDYIVNSAKATGLNPAIFLGYWKTESKFSTLSSRDMGCNETATDFYNQVDCALGINLFINPANNPVANCAKSKDASSIACTTLKGIRAKYDTTHSINYPIKTFDDFAEAYGPYDDLTGGQPTNCTHTYNELIETAKELGVCQTAPAPLGGSDFATQLVDKIKKSLVCNGIVSRSNAQPCVDSIRPVPVLTANEIISSAESFIYLQCIGFVQAIVGGITGQGLAGIPYAYMYIYFPPSGYKFITRTDTSAIMKVGDLAIWYDINFSPWGHIAYIVKVYDSSTFDVAEANWRGPGVVGLRKIDINEPGFTGWAQKQ